MCHTLVHVILWCIPDYGVLVSRNCCRHHNGADPATLILAEDGRSWKEAGSLPVCVLGERLLPDPLSRVIDYCPGILQKKVTDSEGYIGLGKTNLVTIQIIIVKNVSRIACTWTLPSNRKSNLNAVRCSRSQVS